MFEYKTSEVEVEVIEPDKNNSRDQRPDLKQYTMQLICSGGIPLWMKMGDGNASDQKELPSASKTTFQD